jgi:hypothetical protein
VWQRQAQTEDGSSEGGTMPILTFDVESYTVLTTQSGTTSSGAWRHISLTSTVLAHGIRNRASVYFFENLTGALGVVYNVDQPNFDGQTAYAYCRRADFGDWYDMLRNEQPLKFTYAYAGPDYDPNQPTRELWWVQLYTGLQEPPGEGPEDVQAKLFPADVLDMLRGVPRKDEDASAPRDEPDPSGYEEATVPREEA